MTPPMNTDGHRLFLSPADVHPPITNTTTLIVCICVHLWLFQLLFLRLFRWLHLPHDISHELLLEAEDYVALGFVEAEQ